MHRTKIVYFIPNLQQGGTEGQILALINALPPRFEPVLCVYHADGVFWDARCPPGQPAHALGVRRMNLRALSRLVDILRRERPAIVHSFRDKANFWARLAAARAGVPITITSCRSRMMQLRYLALERFMSRRSRLILVNSIGIEHELTTWAGVPADKIRVIHNLLDLEHFRPPTVAERAAARAVWAIPAGARVFVLPGRIGLQKHQAGVLWAMRALARRGCWPADALVLLAGRERDRRVGALVRRLAADPRIAPSVRFLGAVKDVRSLYFAADVLLLPSLFEGLANAALEGCAAGLPAILSHAANVDGIVQPGATGWEVPTGRHRPLVRAFEAALGARPAELAAMGLRARERVAARFAPTPTHVLDQTIAVYDEMLAAVGQRGD
jgi:glycosyltransferase involved in cell wall biosynthesis